MAKIKSFQEIKIETSISSFAQKQAQLERAFPRINLFEYNFPNNKREQRFNLTKWFRNVAVMDNFQAANIRLGEFFVAVEYFQGNINFERVQDDFEPNYKKRFFLAVAADSLRSSLDILSKCTAWFFDFQNKNEVGFSFKNYLKPIESLSQPIFKSGNQIYRSKAYKMVKEFRDAEKHAGLGKREFELIKLGTKFEAKINNPDPIKFLEIEKACAELYSMILIFSETCVCEFLKFDKGYNSTDDKICKLDREGKLVME